ncbi:hypothetical protein TUBRATIS_003020 [Tubulinosema ratisbonensis]|uniref:Uncharacterized protein n=1 Tax=Tubulinosema ratisbonensis TaxID=291195 RepID=A0A437AQC1_9MICR|nr:hypothetical protein TUBRATIS_003020 [Tubulinosema ratisbonensis]
MASEKSSSLTEFPKPIYKDGYRILTHKKDRPPEKQIEINTLANFAKPKSRNLKKGFVFVALVLLFVFLVSYKVFRVYFRSGLKHSTPHGSFVWYDK